MPWFTGKELNVTEVPVQTVLPVDVIEMLTGWFGLTIMVTVFEMAGLPLAHGALEVNVQVTWSPFTGI